MKISQEALKSLAMEAVMIPQEEMLEIGRKRKNLYIGIPRETSFQENRVALVPDAVALLVSNGHRVLVETNAGKASNFSDNEYSEAGAQIAYDTAEVYKADIIMKVAPPSSEEIALMQPRQTLISALQLSVQPKDTLKKLMSKKITAIAWEHIRDEEGIFPVVRSMGEIAGTASILIAAEYLSKTNNGKGMIMGGVAGISPTEVVILGAGTVGEYATRSALGLGAIVKVFDSSLYRLRRLQNDLGVRLNTSILQPRALEKSLKTADVVIGAIRAKGGRTPCVVSETMVDNMREGTVLIDVSIDQGGCFETSRVTTHTNPVFDRNGVIHYCVPNIPSRVPRTASIALSNIFGPLMIAIGDKGGSDKLIRSDLGFRAGVYILNGTLTNPILGEAFGLPYKDIDLLSAGL
ncbi:MAG: alanine dehydrogenase [Flavobacteriales bacterium]|nr:alanine dehydrogenase [Flavobacteriales bacterium]HRE74193.1 alanine dehydrogenase [Flavobacteriales bacterium]HRJ36201.1 alanine dehydrogenase [Flavobacteriales bacterium]HRJ38202.1 alanine dehydrogenase [Flavobacteriales bacterium]